MNEARLGADITAAQSKFDYVEAHRDAGGQLYVKVALQTSQRMYICSIKCAGYPNRAPHVFVTQPDLHPSDHQYNEKGRICYIHPNLWNPGRHDIAFVVARTAKWLHKYEVQRRTGRWPGAGLDH